MREEPALRALVTGGAGFIGSHLVDALVARGDEVTVIDDLSTGDRANLNPGAEFHHLDVRDPAAAGLLAAGRFNTVFHLAAQMSVSRSVEDPVFDAEVNIIGGIRFMRAAAAAGSGFILASTGGALYGDADRLPTPEEYPAWPVSPYGVSKLSAEHYLHCFAAESGLRYAALRYANVYGPRQNPHGEAGVVAIFCRALLTGGRPFINGDGRQTRDYVYVDDVVRANLLAADAPGNGHLNVGTGRQTDVNQLFRLIVNEVGVDCPEQHREPRAGEQRTSALDCSRIRAELGWEPELTLEAGLARTVAWFRENS
jgi:UDP-glucose 4-epimerase